MKKYTAIWSDFNMCGSHNYSIVRVCRFYKPESLTFEEVLLDYGISMSSVNFIFLGWIQMEGEKSEEIVESPIANVKEK